MAKVTFTKLGLTKAAQEEILSISVNGIEVEIKQYLPINKKLELIQQIVNQTVESEGFFNPVKLEVFASLAIVQFYTNITFTDKQREDFCKTFDLLDSNGVITAIINGIPEEEYKFLIDSIQECAENIVEFNNSVFGILNRVSADYSNLNLDVDQMVATLSDPTQLEMVKNLASRI